MNVGREVVYTPYKYINKENVISVLQDIFPVFRRIAGECQELIDFEAGKQPLQRKHPKKVMSWIDFECVDNVASEITSFWNGFAWGFPISLVQRGDIETNESIAKAIAELNNSLAIIGNNRKLQELAFFLLRCGIGYTFIDINKEWEEGDSYFTKDVLDPRNSCVVRSAAYSDKRVVLAFSCCLDEQGNYYITAFTKEERFEIKAIKHDNVKNVKKINDDYFIKYFDWGHAERSGEENPLHKIPIIEWIRDIDRTGVFEKQIPSINTLNLMLSDIMNGIDQGIQSFFWTNDVELEKQEVKDSEGNISLIDKKPGAGDWLHTATLPNGTQPKIQPLTLDYHLSDMQDNYLAQRTLILENAHVPQRNDNSGGSTGVAMDTAAGWSDAENIASAQENITIACQMEELRVILAAIRESTDIETDNPMLSLMVKDIQPAIRRPKNYDIANKVNGIATLLSHGFALEDCVANIPFFPDVTQVIERSGEGVKKYQETIWNSENEAEGGEDEQAPNSDRTMQDNSDQNVNSPYIGK